MQNKQWTPYSGGIKAVISDLAGTTIDFGSCAPAESFVELFRRYGIEITHRQARGPMGLHKRDHIAALLQLPDVLEKWKLLYGRSPDSTDLDVLYAEFIPIQIDVLPRFSKVIGCVNSVIESLGRHEIRFAVTTGYNRAMTNIVLHHASGQGFCPECSSCVEDVASGRPAPWMIYDAMEKLGIYPSASVLVIGDTVHDIHAGRNAGTWTVAVTATGNFMGMSEQELACLSHKERQTKLDAANLACTQAGAHVVIEHFTDLPEVIDCLNNRIIAGDRP